MKREGLTRRVRETGRRIGQDVCGYWKAAAGIAAYLTASNLMFGTVCPMVFFTGLPCPGCGMTRAFLLVLQLRFAEAWEMHPLVYGWIALAAVFCVRRYGMGKSTKGLVRYAALLLIAMAAVYVWRMKTWFPVREPMTYTPGSVLERIQSMARMR